MPKNKPQEQLEDLIKRFGEQLNKTAEKIIEVWGNSPIFVDVSLLFSVELKSKALDAIVRQGQKLGGIFIPVIHLNDDKQIKDAAFKVVKDINNGVVYKINMFRFF